ncbi:hypothetical protein [Nocardioides plantarum]|uniref:Membrane protein involved in the export of O-antigen and teichoic acid n=1 Tax=Nocardioides plantarum TaxID=29299 RepID=A0ABV5K6G3_9ACTN|nr:hypothetical protein [Nocardioides plantarum]
MAKDLGAQGRGEFAEVLIVITLLSWVGYLGLPRGLAAGSQRGGAVGLRAVGSLLGLGVASAFVAAVVAPAALDTSPIATDWLRASSAILIVSGFGQLGSELAAINGSLRVWNSIRFVSLVIPSLAMVPLHFASRLTLNSALAVTVAATLAATLLGMGYLSPRRTEWSRPARVPWSFSLSYWFGTAFDSVGGRGDQLVLASLGSTEMLGLYAVATTCSSITGGVGQALNVIAYGRRRGDASYARRHSRVLLLFSLGLGGGMVAGVWVFGEDVFGPDFSSLYQVVAVLVFTQALSDQWQWRVYLASLNQRAKSLPVASGSFLLTLVLGAWALHELDDISALSMAGLTVVANAVRLAVHRFLQQKSAQEVGPSATGA